MAKISARGDCELVRFRHPVTKAEIVFTMRGRLLSKPKGGSFKLAFYKVTRDYVERYAEQRGMERV